MNTGSGPGSCAGAGAGAGGWAEVRTPPQRTPDKARASALVDFSRLPILPELLALDSPCPVSPRPLRSRMSSKDSSNIAAKTAAARLRAHGAHAATATAAATAVTTVAAAAAQDGCATAPPLWQGTAPALVCLVHKSQPLWSPLAILLSRPLAYLVFDLWRDRYCSLSPALAGVKQKLERQRQEVEADLELDRRGGFPSRGNDGGDGDGGDGGGDDDMGANSLTAAVTAAADGLLAHAAEAKETVKLVHSAAWVQLALMQAWIADVAEEVDVRARALAAARKTLGARATAAAAPATATRATDTATAMETATATATGVGTPPASSAVAPPRPKWTAAQTAKYLRGLEAELAVLTRDRKDLNAELTGLLRGKKPSTDAAIAARKTRTSEVKCELAAVSTWIKQKEAKIARARSEAGANTSNAPAAGKPVSSKVPPQALQQQQQLKPHASALSNSSSRSEALGPAYGRERDYGTVPGAGPGADRDPDRDRERDRERDRDDRDFSFLPARGFDPLDRDRVDRERDIYSRPYDRDRAFDHEFDRERGYDYRVRDYDRPLVPPERDGFDRDRDGAHARFIDPDRGELERELSPERRRAPERAPQRDRERGRVDRECDWERVWERERAPFSDRDRDRNRDREPYWDRPIERPLESDFARDFDRESERFMERERDRGRVIDRDRERFSERAREGQHERPYERNHAERHAPYGVSTNYYASQPQHEQPLPQQPPRPPLQSPPPQGQQQQQAQPPQQPQQPPQPFRPPPPPPPSSHSRSHSFIGSTNIKQ